MELIKTPLEGCFIVKPVLFGDSRGTFFESFNHKRFEQLTDKEINFVQDNVSVSTYGVIRGLHYQAGDFAQAKLVSVMKGSVLDVAVDLRKESSTYGQYFSIQLDDIDRLQLFVPKGFAHGFATLSTEAIFSYKCDQYYNKQAESGIRFDDPSLSIDWKIPFDKAILSDKDLQLPVLSQTIKEQ